MTDQTTTATGPRAGLGGAARHGHGPSPRDLAARAGSRDPAAGRPRRPEAEQPPRQPVLMTGAQALVAALERLGVDVVFGIPGGAILPAYDPLFDSETVRHILVRHEQGAGHAAAGYAQATGRPGVCIATSGPGATNLVTPLADAYMDSVPVVAITGQVPSSLIGTDGFQEADIAGITLPVTKHNFLVTEAGDIARTVAEAFHVAATGRPGPVLVDIAKDALQAKTQFRWPVPFDLPGYHPVTRPHSRQVREAARMMMAAQRPVLYVGGGVIKAGASAELLTLAELTGMPVVTTLMARGAFPSSHQQNLGMPGMHGKVAAVGALQKADLLVALGARFDDRVTGRLDTFAPEAATGGLARHLPPRLRRAGRRLAVTAVRDRADRQAGRAGRGVRGGRRPAPDVGRPVHRPRAAPALAELRRARHDGLRGARRHGREGGHPGVGGVGDRRRRLLPDDQPGARHLHGGGHPDQGGHHQQRQPGHGPPVADALLQRALLPDRPGPDGAGHLGGYPDPGLRQAGRGLRLRRPALRDRRRRGRGDQAGHGDQRPPRRDRLHRAPRRDGLADGGRGHQQRRHQGGAGHGAGLGCDRMSQPPVRLREQEPSASRHTLSVLVENKPGVLVRIAGLFSRRGFNIESLAVGPTEHHEISRMTIVVNCAEHPLEQVTKQLNKLINVLKIVELEPAVSVQRELLLVKVRADAETRSRVLETVAL